MPSAIRKDEAGAAGCLQIRNEGFRQKARRISDWRNFFQRRENLSLRAGYRSAAKPSQRAGAKNGGLEGCKGPIAREVARQQKGVMASRAVSKFGRTTAIFVPPPTKINGPFYKDRVLANGLPPQCRALAQQAGVSRWVSQQDNAPSHREAGVLKYLKTAVARLFEPWPSKSPDCSPLDYTLWRQVQTVRNAMKPTAEMEARAAVTIAIGATRQTAIDTAIDGFLKRIQAAIDAEGGHIEARLK